MDNTVASPAMLSWILGFLGVYLLGMSVSIYLKTRSWALVSDRLFLFTLTLLGFLFSVRGDGNLVASWVFAALGVILGLWSIYYIVLSVGSLLRTHSWADVRRKVNILLFAMAALFIFALFGCHSNCNPAIKIAWAVGVILFGLIALWNMLWITFTKKDFPFLAPLATGTTLALYVVLVIYAYKEWF